MLSAAHTLISLPLGLYVHNPLAIFAAAFVLHLLCDTLLHWNIFHDQHERYPYLPVALDVGSGLLAAYALLDRTLFTLPLLAAVAGGNAPDIIHHFWDIIHATRYRPLLAWLAPFFTMHDKLQHETAQPVRGLISQLVLTALAVTLITLR